MVVSKDKYSPDLYLDVFSYKDNDKIFVGADFYIDDNKNLNGRTGEWWTKTSFYDDVQIVNYMGGVDPAFPKVRGIGARPAVSYSSIELTQ